MSELQAASHNYVRMRFTQLDTKWWLVVREAFEAGAKWEATEHPKLYEADNIKLAGEVDRLQRKVEELDESLWDAKFNDH